MNFIQRVANAAVWLLDILGVGFICAAFGGLALPMALLITDLLCDALRHGHGPITALAPLTARAVGLHPLALMAIFGATVGFGYSLWSHLSFLERSP